MTDWFEETAEGIHARAPRSLRIRLPAGVFGILGLVMFVWIMRQAVRGPTWGDTAGLSIIALLPLAIGGVFLIAAFHRRDHVTFHRITRRVSGYVAPRWRLGRAFDRPFSDIRDVAVRTIDFDAGPSHVVEMTMTDGETVTLGFANTPEEADQRQNRIAQLIA